jgi:hypothetical protein
MKGYSGRQFAFFRLALGAYLAVHFLQLIPCGAELFSCEGMLPEARVNLTAGLFPNPLACWDSPGAVTFFLSALSFLSIIFAIGYRRQPIALLLWFGWACLFNRNNLILNPSLPYIGLLLLLSALVPAGEGWSPGQVNPAWQLPAGIYWAGWFLLAAGYSYSGAMKLISPSWIDGSALFHILNNPLARPGAGRDLLLQLPASWLQLATWGSLAAELSFLPLSFCLTTRKIVWGALVGLHLAILCLVNFADLTLAMLLAQLFVFDSRWLGALPTVKPAQEVCGCRAQT